MLINSLFASSSAATRLYALSTSILFLHTVHLFLGSSVVKSECQHTRWRHRATECVWKEAFSDSAYLELVVLQLNTTMTRRRRADKLARICQSPEFHLWQITKFRFFTLVLWIHLITKSNHHLSHMNHTQKNVFRNIIEDKLSQFFHTRCGCRVGRDGEKICEVTTD